MPIIPWDDVEMLVKSGIPARRIASKLGMPDQEERIKRQITRKGWARQAPTAILNAATKQLITVKSEIVPNVPKAANAMAEMGEDSKFKGAIALNNGLGYFASLPAPELAVMADKFKALVSTGTPLHGWDKDSKAPLNLSFTMHCGVAEPERVIELDRPVIEQEVV